MDVSPPAGDLNTLLALTPAMQSLKTSGDVESVADVKAVRDARLQVEAQLDVYV